VAPTMSVLMGRDGPTLEVLTILWDFVEGACAKILHTRGDRPLVLVVNDISGPATFKLKVVQ